VCVEEAGMDRCVINVSQCTIILPFIVLRQLKLGTLQNVSELVIIVFTFYCNVSQWFSPFKIA